MLNLLLSSLLIDNRILHVCDVMLRGASGNGKVIVELHYSSGPFHLLGMVLFVLGTGLVAELNGFWFPLVAGIAGAQPKIVVEAASCGSCSVYWEK